MEDHDLKEAIKCEKAALRAEREAMREERLAFAAELEQIRKERAELHAEKERIQAEREALKTASEIARKIQQRTGKVYKGRKKISGFDVSRVNGVCNPKIAEKIETPIKLTPYKQEKYIILDSLDRAAQDRNWKSGPKTRLKQKIQCLAQTENKEGSSEGRAGLNSWPKRKKNYAALRTEKDRNENISKTRQQLRYNMLGSGDSERNVTPLRVSEEEDLEDLKVSFDKPGVSLIQTSSLPASQVTKAADSNVAEAMDVNVSACGLTAKPDRPRGISSPTCKDCGRSFRWTSHYLNHLKSHTAGGDKSRQCEVFGRINHLAVRMPKQHVCSHCALTFTTLTTLQKHVHSNHKQWARTKKEFKCSECREVFTKASSLATHMGVHRNGKPFRCTDCSSAFTSQGNLTVHMRKHRGEKPFKCTECDATFPRLADLRSHSRKHSTVKPYVCCTCPAAFCRPGDLKPHMRTHTGEKPFQCEVCGAAFSTSSNLAVHRRTHTGERPFQCEQCGAAFSQLGHLTRHRTQHAYEHSHRCTSCPATFGNAYHLKVHMQRHNTENTFKCKCGAAFSRASILTEHMRIHTGEKPYKCNQCPAAFARSANLAAHRRKHTGERPYVCPHCQQGFTQSTSLNRHIQSKSACQSRLGQSKSEDAEAEVMETTALGESPQSSSIQRVPEVLELSSSVDGNADRLGSCFFREKPKCLDKYALTAHESGIGDNHFLSATPIVNGATIPLQTLEHWDGMSLPANSEGKMANPDSVRLSDILLVDKPQGERLATASDYPRQQYGDITLQQSAIASTNVAKCGVTERNLPVSSFHSQVNASCTASKNGIFSEGNLSISTSLHPQISSLHITVNSLTKNGSVPLDTSSHVHANSSSVDTEGTVSSVSLHLTGDARSSILLLPPAGTMTDYEEQVRTSAETLIAMKSMSHPSSYFHSHLSSPTRSNLSSTQ